MNVKKALLSFTFILIMGMTYAQTGFIRGKVIDDATGEELIGVTVVLKGTTQGAITDFDGTFQIKTAPGTYDVQVSFVSFETITIQALEVIQGEATTLYDIRLKESVEELEAVVITAEVIKNSESALLTVKKKSANLLDGISAQSFRKIGDSDAASAVKRVTGVSVEGGKYVYVRGLGDRYTKSILNGMDIPGLDPDRNSLQMDIFPTNVIDNLVVFKSFTTDLPADFTGGVVNIETKDFPEEKTFNISVGYGFNPAMHFNSDFLTYEGSSTDFLGFDNGDRDLPIGKTEEIPLTVLDDPLTTELTRKFDQTLAADTKTSLGNISLGASFGNQRGLGAMTLGYNAALSYRNNNQFFDNVEYNTYLKPDDLDQFQLRLDRFQRGSQGINNAQLSGLAGLALKNDRSKYKLNFLHIQNGETRAGIYGSGSLIQGSWSGVKDVLEYSERRLSNVLVAGEHNLIDSGWEIEWKLSPTISGIEDKDIRSTPYRTDGGGFAIEPSESGDPTRIWRNLDEVNLTGRVDFTKSFQWLAGEAKLKFGSGYSFKERDYEILNYRIRLSDPDDDNPIVLTGDPDQLLADDFIWTVETDRGSAMFGNFEASNTYNATQTNLNAYVSTEVQLTQALKTILGVRMENYDQFYTGVDQAGDSIDNENIISSLKFFPSANLILALNDNSNIRASYSRTIARPSFKEASIAQIFDPLNGRTFIGGLRPFIVNTSEGQEIRWDGELDETDIDNFDLRFETFQSQGQTFSVSVFYKAFTNPLELVVFSESAADNFQTRNLGDASVFGVEFEARKNLTFISPSLQNFSINTNVSLVESRLEMDKTPGGEFESRQENAREGESIEDTRNMQGQAPYLINAGLAYANQQSGWEGGLYYNVQGRRLSVVGVAGAADVYDQPFHSLNFSLSKRLGKELNSQIQLRVSNLLDDIRESFYESFGSSETVFQRINPGRTFSLSYRHSF